MTRVTQSRLDMAVSGDTIDEDLVDSWSTGNTSLRLDLLANEATHRKLMEVLDAVKSYRDGPAMHILNVLFGLSPAEEPCRSSRSSFRGLTGQLNESQMEAVAMALESKDVALIHGPPGKRKAKQ